MIGEIEKDDEAELRQRGQALLDAAYAYWEQMQKMRLGGALFWLDDDDGKTVIFTRGEYRHTLMDNVDRLRREAGVRFRSDHLQVLSAEELGIDRLDAELA